MSRGTVRISRTVGVWDGGDQEYVVAVDLPPSATRHDVAVAIMELDRLGPFVEAICPHCRTAPDTVHQPDCPFTFDDQIERCRQDAIEDGMTP